MIINIFLKIILKKIIFYYIIFKNNLHDIKIYYTLAPLNNELILSNKYLN